MKKAFEITFGEIEIGAQFLGYDHTNKTWTRVFTVTKKTFSKSGRIHLETDICKGYTNGPVSPKSFLGDKL